MTFEFFLPQNGSLKNIHLKLTDNHQKKTFTFRTPLRITAENWDADKQRPSNIYIKKYKKINRRLNLIKTIISENVRLKRNENKTICHRTLTREVQKICTNTFIEKPKDSLLLYMEQYISSRKELICHSTYKRYKVFYHLVERFEGHALKKLYIDTVDSDFITDFIHFGKIEEYSKNTIYRTIHFVKTILNFAERKGIRTHVRELELRRERQHKEMTTLTEKEILRIQSTEVSDELKPAKDWLLISCYTGQRFSDFIRFNTNQLKTINGKTCISFTQQKTQKDMVLPLHPTVLHVLQRNEDNFPKVLDIQIYNHHIKQIAKLAELNESIEARKRLGYRTKKVFLEKWEVLSSHIGRRSFATNFFGKIPTPLLMEATGHSSENIFMKYINPINSDRIMNLSHYFDKMYEERVIRC